MDLYRLLFWEGREALKFEIGEPGGGVLLVYLSRGRQAISETSFPLFSDFCESVFEGIFSLYIELLKDAAALGGQENFLGGDIGRARGVFKGRVVKGDEKLRFLVSLGKFIRH